MTIDLYGSLSPFVFKIRALLDWVIEMRFTLEYLFPSLHVVFVYNIRRLKSQITLTKNNMIDLGLNPGQLVR